MRACRHGHIGDIDWYAFVHKDGPVCRGEQHRAETGRLELVMTGPEPPGAMIRDTGVVVRQMFLNATQSICICGFAVYQGKDIFLSLANRMLSAPDLTVRMYLNIERPYGDSAPTDTLIAKFQQRFRETQWPKDVRLPDVYFDPRALEHEEAGKSACLHAKFVIADSRQVFISSANFTEAAQQRNIEAGVLSENASLAGELRLHFQSLIDHGHLERMFSIPTTTLCGRKSGNCIGWSMQLVAGLRLWWSGMTISYPSKQPMPKSCERRKWWQNKRTRSWQNGFLT